MPPSKRAQKLGNMVAKARQSKGLSLRDAAEQMDVHWTYLQKVEQGGYESPAEHYRAAFSRVLDIPLDELLKVAGYREKLPEFSPYLRTKYDLPEQAVEQLNDYFQQLQEQHARGPKKPAKGTKKAGGR